MSCKCCRCGKTKDASQFYAHPHTISGCDSYCKTCRSAYGKERYATSRHRRSEMGKLYYRRRKQGDPAYSRKRHLQFRYGLTLEKYEAMCAAQDGRCAICGRQERLVVDHNHTTGAVRGLLCQACNSTLGFVAEQPERLQAAIHYLETACVDCLVNR